MPPADVRRRHAGRSAQGQDLLPAELVPDFSGKDKRPLVAEPKVSVLGLFSLKAATVESLSLWALTIGAFVTRFIWLSWSNKVVWDEAHFGKFGSHYIKRDFYFDVHPPLGKTLIGISGMLAGYDGSFEFESGKEYPDNLNYAFMRGFCALWGALMVPFAYLTARELKMSHWASFAAGAMILFDNAFTVISRFILLDSLLLFGTVISMYCFVKFANQKDEPFSIDWWTWLILTGVALGFVSSVKWVGFFIVALVGLYTLENLWDLFGDTEMPKTTYLMHWVARIACLIVIPVMIYVGSFALHFAILNRSGPGDAQMSSLFQSNLIGTNIQKSPLVLHYGSKFTLKNVGYGGGLLHSHVQTYPHGSKQQQVTCYHHKDSNNDWVISKHRGDVAPAAASGVTPAVEEKPIESPEIADLEAEVQEGEEERVELNKRGVPSMEQPTDESVVPVPDANELPALEQVLNGDVVRFVHHSTGKNLHSHSVAAPVTKTMNEVSGYGNDTIGDANDYWVVEIVDDLKRGKGSHVESIHTLTTRVRLRHKTTGCLLRSHNVNLPQWGFKQAEVACDKRSRDKADKDVYNMWNVENHWNDRLPIADSSHFKTSFWQDFLHLNVAMWTSNNALVPDPDKEPDQLTSLPREWPLMQAGIRMCSWGDGDIKFYMLGNPLVWWAAIGAVGVYAGLWVGSQILFQRKLSLPGWTRDAPAYAHFVFAGKWLLLGWVLHYMPFGLMGRVTYLHHYFPALYFTVLLAAFVLDVVLIRSPRIVRDLAWLAVVGAVAATFFKFAGMTFGFTGPAREWGVERDWMSSWRMFDRDQS
ncbi:Dolichyl-phosphate-mannose-protein mannosyltransferase-domain-containing protein [Blastocladiella britannica]|nr:Dolichyl-phosphate-mannose-protein mannosyltransferase-domain-containing protein [Blastocladiella britannica]